MERQKPVFITTPPGKAVYPNVHKPNTKFDADGVYTLKLIWKTEAVAPLISRLEKMRDDYFAALKASANDEKDPKKKAKLKKALATAQAQPLPFKTVLDDEGEPTDETQAEFKLPAITRWKDHDTGEEKTRVNKPVVVDAHKKPTKAEPWSGSIMAARISVVPEFWEGMGKVGLKIRLTAAQIIKLVQGGGGPQDNLDEAFEDHEDGFTDDDFADDDAASKSKASNSSDDDAGGDEDDSDGTDF